ncbi:hypothetical protein J6590_054359 [Homalodisca vitripennis]|nr:hypothetical protein J6590_054359 [Homalodisca vitripennis]
MISILEHAAHRNGSQKRPVQVSLRPLTVSSSPRRYDQYSRTMFTEAASSGVLMSTHCVVQSDILQHAAHRNGSQKRPVQVSICPLTVSSSPRRYDQYSRTMFTEAASSGVLMSTHCVVQSDILQHAAHRNGSQKRPVQVSICPLTVSSSPRRYDQYSRTMFTEAASSGVLTSTHCVVQSDILQHAAHRHGSQKRPVQVSLRPLTVSSSPIDVQTDGVTDAMISILEHAAHRHGSQKRPVQVQVDVQTDGVTDALISILEHAAHRNGSQKRSAQSPRPHHSVFQHEY